MEYLNAYTESIAISLIIIASYFFNFISKKTKVPSVLLLIGLGIAVKYFLAAMNISLEDYFLEALELLGIVGLIMIVLEAALGLTLKKENKFVLIKSFFMALAGLLGVALSVAFVLHLFLFDDFLKSLIYAIPLSILSSAIIIPSVQSLLDSKREFLTYESTFSDVIAIMFFYFVLGGIDSASSREITIDVSSSIAVTILLSFVISYIMILLLQKMESKVKLFFLISVLVLLYSTGKMLDLPSLVIIMVFGLILNNHTLFFRGRLHKLIDPASLQHITNDFHIVTRETSFLVRTFFFVIFGITLDFSGITDLSSIYIALTILSIIYGLRFLLLKLFVKRNITPQLWIAPRGLITVLLFFSIPASMIDDRFNPSILLIVILATSIIMSLGLFIKKEDIEEVDQLSFDDWDELDKEIEDLKSS